MANSRQEEKTTRDAQEEKTTRGAEETFQRTTEKAAEQTRRIGLAGSQAGEEMSQASANLLQQNAEMLQNNWRLGLEMVTTVFTRSADQLGQTLGLSGNEAQEATERSARNAKTILHSASTVTKGINGISREYLDFARHQLESNLDHMKKIWQCRNPQEVAALQTEVVRATVARAVESGRRIADMSLRVTEDAGKQIAESVDRAA